MKSWLFTPFRRIAGLPALIAGLAVIALTAVLAHVAGLHTSGVLTLQLSPTLPLWVLLVQGLVNWAVMAGCLLVAGYWLGARRFRPIDLLGTQALARAPLALGALYLTIPPIHSQIRERTLALLEAMPDDPSQVIAPVPYLIDALWLTVISLPLLFMVGWLVWLMYHSYSLCCHLSGSRAVLSFTAALIAAMIISSLLLMLIG